MGISAAGLRAGKAAIELSLSDDKIPAALQQLERRMKSFGKAMADVGAAGLAMGTAILGPMAAMAKSFSDAGSSLADMQQRTGLSAQGLSELQFAAQQTGTDMGAVEKGLQRMAKNGQNPQDFFEIARGIASIEDPVKRTQAALKTWGKTGTMLLPMIANLDELRAKAVAMGLTWDESMIAKADTLGDAIDLLKAQFSALTANIGKQLASSITEYSAKLSEIAAKTIQWVKENGNAIVSIANLALKVAIGGAALVAFGAILTRTIAIVRGLMAIIVAMSAHPLIALGTIIAGLVLAFSHWAGWLDGVYKKLAKIIGIIPGLTIEAGKLTEAVDPKDAYKEDLKNRIEANRMTTGNPFGVTAARGAINNDAFQREAKLRFHNLLANMPAPIASLFGQKLAPEVEHAFEKLGKAMADFSNAAATPELDVTPYIEKLKAMGAGLDVARAVSSPVSTFDPALARQMFGATDDSIEREQLKVQKQMLAQLKNRSGGLPVV